MEVFERPDPSTAAASQRAPIGCGGVVVNQVGRVFDDRAEPAILLPDQYSGCLEQ
jgi:hypothetical protein